MIKAIELDSGPFGHAITGLPRYVMFRGSGLLVLENVHLIAMPMLLREKPFVQGITACHRLGKTVGRAVLRDLRRHSTVRYVRPVVSERKLGLV